MRTIKVRSILDQDTISKGNDKPWNKLSKYIDENLSGEEIEFDFDGIEVIQPCSSLAFTKLLTKPEFNMTLHNAANTIESVKMMCVLNNIPTSKAKNIEMVIQHEPTQAEKNMESVVTDLCQYFVDADGRADLQVYRRFDQIGQPKTVEYIKRAIMRHSKETGINDVIISTNSISIQQSVYSVI